MPGIFDPENEPDGDVSLPHHLWLGLFITTFAFGFIWPNYPRLGAILTLTGLLVSLDDAIEHAFNVRTPLDELYKRWLRPLLQRFEHR